MVMSGLKLPRYCDETYPDNGSDDEKILIYADVTSMRSQSIVCIPQRRLNSKYSKALARRTPGPCERLCTT